MLANVRNDTLIYQRHKMQNNMLLVVTSAFCWWCHSLLGLHSCSARADEHNLRACLLHELAARHIYHAQTAARV